MSFLGNLQNKSKETKSQYAFGIASVVTGLIAIVWISTVPAQFAKLNIKEATPEEKAPGLDSLISDTKSQLGSIIESTGDTVPEEVVSEINKNLEASNLGTLDMNAPTPEIVDQGDASFGENTSVTTGNLGQLEVVTTTPPKDSTPATTSPSYVDNRVGTTTQKEPLIVTPSVPKFILIGTTTSQKTQQ